MAVCLVNAFIPNDGGGACLEWKCRVVFIDTENRFMMYVSFIIQYNNPFSFLKIGHYENTHRISIGCGCTQISLYHECIKPIHHT